MRLIYRGLRFLPWLILVGSACSRLAARGVAPAGHVGRDAGRAAAHEEYGYGASFYDNAIWQYRIAPDGHAEFLCPPTAPTGIGPFGVVVSRTHRSAYALTQGDHSISQYHIGAYGKLAPMTPEAVPVTGRPTRLFMGPDEQAVYVVDSASDSIFQFRISTRGTLETLAAPVVLPAQTGPPYSIAFNPNGRYLYVTGPPSGDIAQFRVGARGELSPLVPAMIHTTSRYVSLSPDPTGRYIGYSGGGAPGVIPQWTIAQYLIGRSGQLMPRPAFLIHSLEAGGPLVYGPRGRFVYMIDVSGDGISQYRIQPHGELTPLAPAKVKTMGEAGGMVFSPSGRFAYVTASDNEKVLQFRVRPDGSLAPLFPPSVPAGFHPGDIRFDLTGRYVYVENIGGPDSQYRIQPNGTLQPMDPSTLPEGAFEGFILLPRHPPGSAGHPAAPGARAQPARYVCVLNETAQTVTSYPIDTDGTLCSASRRTIPTGPSPNAMAAAPGGHNLYVANQGDNTISQYRVGQEGVLRPLAPPKVPAGNHPQDLVFHPKEPFAYVVDSASNEIRRYRVGANGQLQWIASQRLDGVEDPVSMTIEPTGRFAYVASQEGRQGSGISQFSVQADGSLVPLKPAHLFPSFQPPYPVMSFIRSDPVRPLVYLGSSPPGVAEYQIQADGTLKWTRSVVGQGAPHCLGFDLKRQTAYDPLNGNQVLQYRIEQDGSWVPLPGEYLEEQSVPRCVAIDESGQFAYVTNEGYVTNERSSTISEYRIGENGRLVPLVPAQVPTGEQPTDIVVIAVPPGRPQASGSRAKVK